MLLISTIIRKIHVRGQVDIGNTDSFVFLVIERIEPKLHQNALRFVAKPPYGLNHGYSLSSKLGSLGALVHPKLSFSVDQLRSGLASRI